MCPVINSGRGEIKWFRLLVHNAHASNCSLQLYACTTCINILKYSTSTHSVFLDLHMYIYIICHAYTWASLAGMAIVLRITLKPTKCQINRCIRTCLMYINCTSIAPKRVHTSVLLTCQFLASGGFAQGPHGLRDSFPHTPVLLPASVTEFL